MSFLGFLLKENLESEFFSISGISFHVFAPIYRMDPMWCGVPIALGKRICFFFECVSPTFICSTTSHFSSCMMLVITVKSHVHL